MNPFIQEKEKMNQNKDDLINFVMQILETRASLIKGANHCMHIQSHYLPVTSNLQNSTENIYVDFMNLHWIHDVPDYLRNCKEKTSSVFTTVFIGENTFWQLREAFFYADQHIYKGHFVRLIPMISTRSIANLLHISGFRDVVSDVTRITLTYDTLSAVFKDMKDHHMRRPLFANAPLSKKVQHYTENYLKEKFGSPFSLSLEIIFATGFVEPAPTK